MTTTSSPEIGDPQFVQHTHASVDTGSLHQVSGMEVGGILLAMIGLCLLSIDILNESRMKRLDAWAIRRLRSIGSVRLARRSLGQRFRDVYRLTSGEGGQLLGLALLGTAVLHGLAFWGGPFADDLPAAVQEIAMRLDFLGPYLVIPSKALLAYAHTWWISIALFAFAALVRAYLGALPWALTLVASVAFSAVIIPAALLHGWNILFEWHLPKFLIYTVSIVVGAMLAAAIWLSCWTLLLSVVHVVAAPLRLAYVAYKRYDLQNGTRLLGFALSMIGLLVTLIGALEK